MPGYPGHVRELKEAAMQEIEKKLAIESIRKRLPYCHLCLLEDIMAKYAPKSEREEKMATELREIVTNARRMSHLIGKSDHE